MLRFAMMDYLTYFTLTSQASVFPASLLREDTKRVELGKIVIILFV